MSFVLTVHYLRVHEPAVKVIDSVLSTSSSGKYFVWNFQSNYRSTEGSLAMSNFSDVYTLGEDLGK